MEIERKFLVKNLPLLEKYEHKEIEQAYLSFDPEIRLRMINREKFYLTKKSPGTISREEEELPISEEVYNILHQIIISPKLQKTRYIIPLNENLIAELDIYHLELEGLQTVEVEFNNLEDAYRFVIPDWFGEEITENLNYKNKNLARVRKNG